MFDKIKKFLKAKKQLETEQSPATAQSVVTQQPAVVDETQKNEDQTVIKTDAKEKMNTDEKVLRYLITGAENFVRSTAGGWCYYIYVKPGMFEDLMRISNIDVVKAVYAEHGIDVKKHISHLNGKEQEVLFIPSSYVAELDDEKLTFLRHTAPAHIYDNDVRKRETELVNKIYHAQRKKAILGDYVVEVRLR